MKQNAETKKDNMNEQNLLKKEDRTPSERRESARKAGIASGKSRAFAKTFREALQAEASKTKTAADGTEHNGFEVLVGRLFAQAVKGDTKAAALIFKMSGEDVQRVALQDVPIVLHDEWLDE